MTERTIHAGDLDLVVAAGPGSDEPVALLHGVARRWQDFLPIVPGLAMRRGVHAVDLRGHGKSARASTYRVIDYVGDIVALVRQEFSRPVVLVGHSLGAMVAAAVAAEMPTHVRAVVLEDPPFAMMGSRLGETQYGPLFVAYRELAGSTQSVENIAAALGEVRVTPHGQDRSVRLGEVRDGASLRFTASCLRLVDPKVFDTILEGRWLDGYDVEGTLARVACPTLWLQGDFAAGGAVPDDYAGALVAKVPRVVHVRMAGVGHMIHAARAEAMTRLVSDFLESLD